jgi:hypothetical protein
LIEPFGKDRSTLAPIGDPQKCSERSQEGGEVDAAARSSKLRNSARAANPVVEV